MFQSSFEYCNTRIGNVEDCVVLQCGVHEVRYGVIHNNTIVKSFDKLLALDRYQIARSSVETTEPDVSLLLTIEGYDVFECSVVSAVDVDSIGASWLM